MSTARGHYAITDPLTRFMSKVSVDESGCWTWLGSKFLSGYGRFTIRTDQRAAHRWSYEHFVGPIPEGFDMDHLCRNRTCVNPAHLEPVTRSENVLRGLSPDIQRRRHAARTHCHRGHPFDATNTGKATNGRYCKECVRLNGKRRRQMRQGSQK